MQINISIVLAPLKSHPASATAYMSMDRWIDLKLLGGFGTSGRPGDRQKHQTLFPAQGIGATERWLPLPLIVNVEGWSPAQTATATACVTNQPLPCGLRLRAAGPHRHRPPTTRPEARRGDTQQTQWWTWWPNLTVTVPPPHFQAATLGWAGSW
jgi:hypothetical protein